jgi:hypothetical protein
LHGVLEHRDIMNQFTKEELEEARRAIDSTITKCEKVLPKLKEGTAQHTLLVRRIKAFQIASSLIEETLESKKINDGYIYEYQKLLQTTNLQKGYQEFVKFFRNLRTYLQKELPEYTFTGNIVENNMDYSYFQFTNDNLKSKGLKIVIAFVHTDFAYQIWLSGLNREVQRKHYDYLKDKSHTYTLTGNPNKTDYILKKPLIGECNYNDLEGLLNRIKISAFEFINNVEQL